MSQGMKIACIGNMNNMMFTMCRYLRDAGFDAHLFLWKTEFFLPGDDCYDESYKDYTTILPIDKTNVHLFELKTELDKILDDFTFTIGTDIAPALMTLMHRKLDMFLPHGTDIYAFPFPQKRDKENMDRVWWLRQVNLLSKLQKIGIENCRFTLFPDEYDIHFPYKDKLNFKGELIDMRIPMVYYPQYQKDLSQSEIDKLEFGNQFVQTQEENDLVVFSHSRHNGFDLKGELEIHAKGNEVLIEGFANLVAKRPNIKAKLVLFQYGIDVDASKNLVSKLKLDNHVVWMPKMKRKEIMFGIKRADISCGQFVNSWLTCGVVNESLSMGKPLLHYRDDSLYAKDYSYLYPLLNANSPDQVCEKMEYFLDNKEEVLKQSQKGIDWLKEFTVDTPLNFIKEKVAEHDGKKQMLSAEQIAVFNRHKKTFSRKDPIYRAINKYFRKKK